MATAFSRFSILSEESSSTSHAPVGVDAPIARFSILSEESSSTSSIARRSNAPCECFSILSEESSSTSASRWRGCSQGWVSVFSLKNRLPLHNGPVPDQAQAEVSVFSLKNRLPLPASLAVVVARDLFQYSL